MAHLVLAFFADILLVIILGVLAAAARWRAWKNLMAEMGEEGSSQPD